MLQLSNRKGEEMDENKKIISLKDIVLLILLLIGILALGGFVFTLIHIPVLFDFRSVPIVGKVFMILGSALVLFGIVLYCVVLKFSEKKDRKAIVLTVLFAIYYLYVLLGYFNFEIWGSKKYFWTIILSGIVLYIGYGIVLDFQTFFNKEKIIMILVAIAFLFATFFVFGLVNDSLTNDYFIKTSLGIVYAVSIPSFIKTTLFSDKTRDKGHFVFPLMISIVIGAGIIISLPFYVKWCGLSGEDFEVFVSVYSALVGGGLTLSGVAWTIYKGEKNRQEEEKKKSKPLFSANRLLSDKISISTQKVCFDLEESEQIGTFPFSVTMEIENSNQSAFTIKKVFHDGKWWEIAGDTVILPNAKTFFHFSFKEDVNNLFLNVQDGLGNAYYYEMKVLLLRLLLASNPSNDNAHTIREIREVSAEEVQKRTRESASTKRE